MKSKIFIVAMTGIICSLIVITIASFLLWSYFHPSPSRVFKSNLSNPIPTEVNRITRERCIIMGYNGYAMKFSIPKNIFEEMIASKGFTKQNRYELKDDAIILDTDNNSPGINLKCDISWLKLKNIESPEVYTGKYLWFFEYLIYDPSNEIAYYLYHTI